MKKGFYWHVHHNILLEWCYGYDERVTVIKQTKPVNEQETRLKLLQPVKGKLPDDLVKAGEAHDKAWEAHDKAGEAHDKAGEARAKAWEAYDKAWEAYAKAGEAYVKAWEAYDKAWEAYDKAWEAYDKILTKHKSFIEKLHKKECGCQEWNGKEIVFPKDKE